MKTMGVDHRMTEHALVPLFGPAELEARIAELGREIALRYRGRRPLLVAILKGSFMFLADLCRAIDEPHEVDFVATEAYLHGVVNPGHVRLVKDTDVDLSSRDVLIVEDIVDSGRTLSKICRLFEARNPASLAVVTLLDKPERREVDVPVTFVGFHVPDEFVVGYGLDLAEQYRHLDGIYICRAEGGAPGAAGENSPPKT
jgi:hypoxanthine phosphoribosyltransferase